MLSVNHPYSPPIRGCAVIPTDPKPLPLITRLRESREPALSVSRPFVHLSFHFINHLYNHDICHDSETCIDLHKPLAAWPLHQLRLVEHFLARCSLSKLRLHSPFNSLLKHALPVYSTNSLAGLRLHRDHNRYTARPQLSFNLGLWLAPAFL